MRQLIDFFMQNILGHQWKSLLKDRLLSFALMKTAGQNLYAA